MKLRDLLITETIAADLRKKALEFAKKDGVDETAYNKLSWGNQESYTQKAAKVLGLKKIGGIWKKDNDRSLF